MPLSYYERKARLKHGDVGKVADEVGVDIGVVSRVLSGKKRRRDVEVALTKRMRDPETAKPVGIMEAFGAEEQ